MPYPFDQPLKIELSLSSSHPQLLAGLDIWLRLGLISDIQVRQLCRQFLVCPVILEPVTQPERVSITVSDPVKSLPVAALASSSRRQTPKPPPEPSFLTSMLQSLGAELSVRWLLFLGLFLVVVSSGVLAASQWERFPASGQYGVLFLYTLSFWGFSFWAGRQDNLRLTAQTLLIVTLLLIPVNFWAMDSFKLWQNPLDWLTVAIACPTLTFITILLCKNRSVFNNLPTGKLPLVNVLGLSYLHWGWQLSNFPVIAIYVAMVGTTIITISHNRYQQPLPHYRRKSPFRTESIRYKLIRCCNYLCVSSSINPSNFCQWRKCHSVRFSHWDLRLVGNLVSTKPRFFIHLATPGRYFTIPRLASCSI